MPGYNDAVILPPSAFPEGSASREFRSAALERAPLRGDIRVLIVLAEFSDRKLPPGTQERFQELAFSTGSLATGSMAEFYREVSGGAINIVGEVTKPYLMPQPLSWYANNNHGVGDPTGEARAPLLARDAAELAGADIDFTPYDNDGNGYVDAFIIVHAGRGGEETGDRGDVWSHKWTTQTEVGDRTKVFGYLTVPEDAKAGVLEHEFAHQVPGWIDLYDTDGSSQGVGQWCLMGAGSWNGGGHRPAHPSAWCKAQQGWVDVMEMTADGPISLPAVQTDRTVVRLSTADAHEYFLLENRQPIGTDELLPGHGLLVWHIDEKVRDNSKEVHPMVRLLQADGQQDLEQSANTGDPGDPFPGASNNRSITGGTNPNTRTYTGRDLGITITDISDSGSTMTARVTVHRTAATALPQQRRRTPTPTRGRPPTHRASTFDRLREAARVLRRPSGPPTPGGR